MLTLTEELFLLSLREKKNSVAISYSADLAFGLVGAMLMELAFAGHIGLDDDRRVMLMENPNPAANQRLASVLKIIHGSTKPRKTTHWIMLIAAKGKKLKNNLLYEMLSLGFLKEEEKKVAWVLPSNKDTQVQAPVKYYRKQELREIVFLEKSANLESIALFSLMRAVNLLENIFTPDEFIMANKRVQEIITDSSVGADKLEIIEKISQATISAAASGNNMV
ncbi:MAG: GPP34 family phosphoprotein [Anaerolineaceae bacterium]